MSEEQEREQWGSQLEYFLSALGFAVGLGNVWRFSNVIFEFGGGSFLIPYGLSLLLLGFSTLFLELAAGQFGRVGVNKLWGRILWFWLGPSFT